MYKLHKRSGLKVSKSGKFKNHVRIQVHNGYLAAILEYTNVVTNRTNSFRVCIHRAVAETFLGRSKLHVNHKDGNKLNNKLKNLEYVSRAGNAKHAHTTGLINVKGSGNGRAKLTEKDVLKIRKLNPKLLCITNRVFGTQYTFRIATKYNVSETTILNIWNKTTWAHI